MPDPLITVGVTDLFASLLLETDSFLLDYDDSDSPLLENDSVTPIVTGKQEDIVTIIF